MTGTSEQSAKMISR